MSADAEREEVIEDASLDWAVAIAERAFEVLGYARESRDRDADIRLAMMLQDLAGRCSSQADRIAGVAAQENQDSRAIADAEVAEHVRVVCSDVGRVRRWSGKILTLRGDSGVEAGRGIPRGCPGGPPLAGDARVSDPDTALAAILDLEAKVAERDAIITPFAEAYQSLLTDGAERDDVLPFAMECERDCECEPRQWSPSCATVKVDDLRRAAELKEASDEPA